jgi:DNA-binding MarR family transcriptional regulator
MSSQKQAFEREDTIEADGCAKLGADAEVSIRPGMPTWAGLRLSVIALRVMQPLYNELECRLGLFRDEAATLVCLSITTAATAQHVVRYTGRPKNSISRAVISLEERGLISRSAHPADGRASCLALTPAGQQMFENIKPDYAAADERLLATLEPDERRLFVALVSKVAAVSADWS